ncbi:hypothetical protein BPNPMPFG_006596 (plasmid) [Mesorhizobium sp. AR07]|nr:hypothetical protein BPNPMPFG_006596 [Mesorhizobium sp. AR07]
MIAVNASTSPHSSTSFTPFGKDALTLAGSGDEPMLSDFDSRSSPRAAGLSTELLCIGRLWSAAVT